MRRGVIAGVASVLLAALCIGAAGSTRAALAQSASTLSYGSSVIGFIGEEQTFGLYSFDGLQGDLVNIRALGTDGGLSPSIELIAPDGTTLISSEDDLYSLETSDAALSYVLPEDGSYDILVEAVGGTSGSYLLQLNGHSPVEKIPLTFDTRVRVPLFEDGTVTYLSFNASEDCPTTITITNMSPGVPFSYPYFLRLRDENGLLVAQARGGRQLEDRVTFALGSGEYALELSAIAREALSDGEVEVALTCGEVQPTCDLPVFPPPTPPTPTPTPTPAIGQLALVQQGGNLDYYQTAINAIGEDSPQLHYTFIGTAGDLINLQVIGISDGFDPQVTLLAPDGQILAVNDDDLFSFNVTDAAVSAILPETGQYSVLISGEGGTFAVRVLGRPAHEMEELTFGETVEIEAPPSRFFTFESQPNCATTLILSNLSEGEPYTFPFVFIVRDENGLVIAQMVGGRQTEDRVIVAPDSGRYEVEIVAADPEARGELEYRTTCAGDALLCDQFIDPPLAELEETPTATSTRIRRSPTDTPTPTPTSTGTNVATRVSLTPQIASDTPTRTATRTRTVTPAPTNTVPPSGTPTRTPSRTPSLTPTLTPSDTFTPSRTPSLTPSLTPSFTFTYTDLPTSTPTDTLTPTDVPTNTDVPTDTPTPTDTPVQSTCGNQICDTQAGENNNNCSGDCFCSDGVCLPLEANPNSPNYCASDCASCGNNFCDVDQGEDSSSCPADCTPPECGNGVCLAGVEDDPLVAGYCGADCAMCGNFFCDIDQGENFFNCVEDCSTPP